MAVDMELKNAFAEMQSKMVDSKQKMRMADLQVKFLTVVVKFLPEVMTAKIRIQMPISFELSNYNYFRLFNDLSHLFLDRKPEANCDTFRINRAGNRSIAS